MSGGAREGFGCQSAGRTARTEKTKTEGSDGYVPMHPVLAEHLKEWHTKTLYKKATDFVFPSATHPPAGFHFSVDVPFVTCSYQRR
jgi:integrase